VWLLILFVPLIVALTWGTFLEKNAYVTFAYARNLVAGRQVTYGLALAGAPLAAPLYVAALASLNKVGIPLAQAGLVLSSLGWGATALTLYYVALTMGQPLTATVSAALMVLNPFMVSTLGTEIPWVLALSWTAIALALKKRWRTQTAVLVLMLGTHFHWSTLVLVTLLLGLRWAEEKRFPLRPSLVLTITALVWALVATRNFGTPLLSTPEPSSARTASPATDRRERTVLAVLAADGTGVPRRQAQGCLGWIVMGSLYACNRGPRGGACGHRRKPIPCQPGH